MVEVIAALGAGLGVAGLLLLSAHRADQRTRALVQRLAPYQRLAGGRAGETLAFAAGPPVLRTAPLQGVPLLGPVLARRAFTARLAADLEAAGLSLGVGAYLLLRGLAGLALAVPAALGRLPLPLVVGLGLLGLLLPALFVRHRQRLRLRRSEEQLLDALSLMANALRSGASTLQAFDLVARELGPPLGEEFGRMVAEIGLGVPFDEVVQALARRLPSEDLGLVVVAMQIQRQTGGNLAEIMEKTAQTIRERQRIMRQVQALTAEQRLSALVVGLLPAGVLGVLLVLSPDYHRPFLAQPLGRLLLGLAFGCQVAGFLVLRRLGRIEV
jgi:tight adherence protein B